MAYNLLEQKRLEEYRRNLQLAEQGKPSSNIPIAPTTSKARQFLPTQSGQMYKRIIASQKQNNNNTWLKKSKVAEDGYQFGDLTKTVLGTTADAGLSLAKGAGSIVEGATDTLTYLGAGVADIVGKDETADRWRKKASENSWVNNLIDPIQNKVDDYSGFGNKTDNVVQGVGYYGGMIALQSFLGVPWQATAGVTAFGSSYGEALNDGSNNKQALVYSLGSAATEIASEYLFGGIKLPGTGKTTEKVVESLIGKFKNQTLARLTKFGVDIAGEGVEETISGTAKEVLKRLTYMRDEEKSLLKNAISGIEDYNSGGVNSQAWQDFIGGVLISAITGGAQNLTQNKNVLPTVNDIVEQERGKTNSNQQILPLDNSLSNSRLNSQENTNQLYTYEKSDNNSINSFRQSAVDYSFANTEDFNNLMTLGEDAINRLGVDVLFDNSIKNESGIAVDGLITNENGKTTIKLNPDSNRAGEFLLTHEITHAIENNDLKDTILTYARQTPNFDKAIKDLQKTYNTKEVSSEVIADISAKILGDQNFINSLVQQNTQQSRNVIQKVYEAIKTFLNNFTQEGRYRNFVSELEKKWRKAYMSQTYGQLPIKNGTMFSQRFDNVIPARYNNGNLVLSKNEYAKISSIIHNKQAQNLDYKGKNFAYSDKYFYIFDDNGFDDFQIKGKIKITENEQLINYIEEAIRNGNNIDSKEIDRWVSDNEIRQGFDYNGNVGIENQRNSTKNDRISKDILQESKENTNAARSNKQNDGNKGLDNSSFSNEVKFSQQSAKWQEYLEKNYPNKNKTTPLRDNRVMPTKESNLSFGEQIDSVMKENIASGNLLYDIDEGIIKRITKERLQLPMRGNSSDNNISQSDKNVKYSQLLPINSNTQKLEKNTKKVLNPNEISKLTPENASTTPKLRDRNRNKLGDGDSSFWNNIKNKANMLTDSQKAEILDSEEVKYYDKITNENSLKKAIEKLDSNGENEAATLLDNRPLDTQKGLKEEANKLYQKIVDKGKYVADLAKKTGNKELYSKYDQMGTARGTAEYSIGVEQVNNKGERVGKSLIDIWEPITESGNEYEFSLYLLHKHNIDRFKQGKPVFGEEITSEMSKEEVKKYEQKYPKFIEWSKDVQTYNRNQLQNMVDAGITSEESQKYYNDTYTNYVRIYRQVNGNSPITVQNGRLKVNSPIKKAKGGNQDILPLKDSMAQQTLEVTSAIRRNEFGLELLDTLGNGEEVTEYGKDIIEKKEDGTYTFTVFRNGQPIKMTIDEGLYESIKPTKKNDWENLLPIKGTRKLLQFQRGIITDKNPFFLIRNFFKDLGDAPLNSKYASKFIKNFPRAYQEIITNGPYARLYKAMGGHQQSYFDNDRGLKYPSKKVTSKFVSKIQKINQAVEMAPRLAEFISSIESGDTIQTAMYNAAEITTNFKRGGEVTKVLNRNFSNFLNASVQGFDKQYINLTGQNGFKGYVNLTLKAVMFGVLPSLLNHLLLDDDDEYEELPDYIKDNYYLFKNGDGKFIRIPKGRVVSIFGNAAVRTLRYINGDKKAFKEYLSNAATNVAPNNPLTSNVFSPFIQIASNKSWNGSEIVPQRLQNLPAEEQFDEKTDEVSKMIGKIFKISPKKVNYMLDQYSGAFGDILLPIATPQAHNNPIESNFVVDSTITNKYSGQFYDLKDEITKKANSVNATDSDILQSKYLNSIQSQISELSKEKREIQMSDMTNKAKLEEVRKIQAEINDIAKDSLINYENIKVGSNFATIDDKYYYKDKLNEWTKVKETDVNLNLAIDSDINMEEYIKYKNAVLNITSDKDSNGKTIANSKKKKIIQYVNSLNLSIPEKAMIIKMTYPSYYNYDKQIINYINKMNISYNEKTRILEEYGFKIRNGRVYSK